MLIPNKRIFIIAGGPSAKGVDFSKYKPHGYILGVNEPGILCPVDGVLTMDRLWWENRWEQCKQLGIDCFVRHTVYDQWKKDINPYSWGLCYRVEMHYDRTELSTEQYVVHGNNSGFCAFNLATLCSPEEIYLFGFDFQGVKSAHWYKQYPWSDKKNGNHYRKWSGGMDRAYEVCKKLGIKVFNCSNASRIKNIPVISEKEILKRCQA